MKKRIGLLMMLVAILAPHRPARAATIYSLLASQSDYSVAPGGSAQVSVYLQEARQSSGDTSLLTSGNGLFGFSLNLTTSGSGEILGASADTSLFAAPVNTVYDPATISASGTLSSDMLLTSSIISSGPGPEGTLSNGGLTRTILLATYSVDAGTLAGANAAFTIQDSTAFGPDPNTITYNDNALDSLIQPGSFDLTVVAPEPGSLGIACIGVWLLSRRRRSFFETRGISNRSDCHNG
jgi:hypothetical protein